LNERSGDRLALLLSADHGDHEVSTPPDATVERAVKHIAEDSTQ